MNGIEKYCRAVSGALTARRATRRRLTDGLADEIRDALGGECTLEQITAAFGPPEQAAEELQLTVGGAEREGERRLWKRSHVLLALLCAALAAVICALVWYGSTMRITVSDTDIFDKGDGTYETLDLFCPGGGAAALDGGPGTC